MKKLLCLAFAAVISLSGCSLLNYETGTAITDNQLQTMQVNKTNKTDILATFGTPSRIMTSGKDQLLCYDHQIIKSFGKNVNESVTFVINSKEVLTKVIKGNGQSSNPLVDAANKQ